MFTLQFAMCIVYLSGLRANMIRSKNQNTSTYSGRSSSNNALTDLHNNAVSISIQQDDVKEDGSAFCLLIKDDNDLLSEWIAYHYHVFNMRRLIVAMDPTSKTSPLDVLQKYDANFSDLHYTLLNDDDYMPSYFLDGPSQDYTKVSFESGDDPRFKSAQDILTGSFESLYSLAPNHMSKTFVKEHEDSIRNDLLHVNNHYFRQKTFVSECYAKVKKEQDEYNKKKNNKQDDDMKGISWTVHIDTDEFLVPNPWMVSYVKKDSDEDEKDGLTRKSLHDMFPQSATAGSLWSLFNDYRASTASITSSKSLSCVMMPRVLFGDKEDTDSQDKVTSTSTALWYHNKFESLRWKYHMDFDIADGLVKGRPKLYPKAIVDVSQLDTHNDDIFQKKIIHSFHQPSKDGCLDMKASKWIYNEHRFEQPLGVYHYLGSYERYMSRGDERRDRRTFDMKNEAANYAKGDLNDEKLNDDEEVEWWISGWLDSFVKVHGSEKVLSVLGEDVYAIVQ